MEPIDRTEPSHVDDDVVLYAQPHMVRLVDRAWAEVRRLLAEETLPGDRHAVFELELKDGGVTGRLCVYRLPPSAHARLLVRLDPSASSEDPGLTPRQLEVLSHVQAGLDPAAISAKLGLALATTRRHLADVSRKLGAARRTGRLMQRSRELDELGRAAGLTARQTEVARQVCLGKDNAEIGAALEIAPATVGSLLTKVYRKLGVRGRHALAAKLSGWLTGNQL